MDSQAHPRVNYSDRPKRQEAERTTEHHRRRVRFFSTVELVNMPEQEKVCNKTGQMAHRLAHMDMVALDE